MSKQNYDDRKQTSADSSSNIALPSLLGWEGYELMLSEEVAEKIGKDIVDNDE